MNCMVVMSYEWYLIVCCIVFFDFMLDFLNYNSDVLKGIYLIERRCRVGFGRVNK